MKTIIGTIKQEDFLKAIRKGSRDAAFEVRDGWVAVNRPHKNKRKYNRKASQSWKN